MGEGLKRAFAAARATRQPRVPESGVLRGCLDLLAAERIWHRRWNTGAVKLDSRFMRFGRKGDADILIAPRIPLMQLATERDRDFPNETKWKPYHAAVFVWCECKASDGKQTPEQREFQLEVEEQGHYYLLVRSSDELLTWLRAHGVTR